MGERKAITIPLLIILTMGTLVTILTLTPIIGGVVSVTNPDLGTVRSNLEDFRDTIEEQCGTGSTFQTSVRTYALDPGIERMWSRPDGIAATLKDEPTTIAVEPQACDTITICQAGTSDQDVSMDCTEGEFTGITEEGINYKVKYEDNAAAIMPIEESE